MIQHIVLLKWKPETTEEQILAAVRPRGAPPERDRRRRQPHDRAQPGQARARLHARADRPRSATSGLWRPTSRIRCASSTCPSTCCRSRPSASRSTCRSTWRCAPIRTGTGSTAPASGWGTYRTSRDRQRGAILDGVADRDMAPTLGEIIRRQRELSAMSMRQFAGLVGISNPTSPRSSAGSASPRRRWSRRSRATSTCRPTSCTAGRHWTRTRRTRTSRPHARGDPGGSAPQRAAAPGAAGGLRRVRGRAGAPAPPPSGGRRRRGEGNGA